MKTRDKAIFHWKKYYKNYLSVSVALCKINPKVGNNEIAWKTHINSCLVYLCRGKAPKLTGLEIIAFIIYKGTPFSTTAPVNKTHQ